MAAVVHKFWQKLGPATCQFDLGFLRRAVLSWPARHGQLWLLGLLRMLRKWWMRHWWRVSWGRERSTGATLLDVEGVTTGLRVS